MSRFIGDSMKTVRFYTNDNVYKGWQYIKNTTFREVYSWLKSGNYVLIDTKTYNSFTSETTLLKLFNR